MVIFKHLLTSLISMLAIASFASADSLLVGFNTQTPVQVYSSAGIYQQDFGPTGASAGIEENGLLYVVQPNISGTDTLISALNAKQTVVSSFSIPDLISDGAPGAGGTLWLSGYDGKVYQVSTQGTVLTSFMTGYSNIGIASNGSTLYTTEGDISDGIDVRNTAGTVLSTIFTGLTPLYGLAYDSSNSSLYAGSFNFVYQFNLTGSHISTLDIPGDARTPNGAIHDGLEFGDLSRLQPTTTIPEPRFGLIAGLLLAPFFRGRRIRGGFLRSLRLAPGLLLGLNVFGNVFVTLNPTALSAPVGKSITFTASASDSTNSSAHFTYQFSVKRSGSASYSVVKDFYTSDTLTWAETNAEGVYDVQVIAKSSSGQSASETRAVTFTSRVTGSTPVVSSTENSLVALYSAPPCSSPKTVRVRFRAKSANSWQATPFKTCDGLSVNFYVAGMLPDTTYILQQDLYNGGFDTPGPELTFKTGSLPALNLPAHELLVGPSAPTSTSFPLVLVTRSGHPFAHDLSGNVVWYLSAYNNPNETGTLLRNTSSGTVLGNMDDPNHGCPATTGYCGDHQFLREFDLAGNVVRETNWTILGQEINALRAKEGLPAAHVTFISHEAFRLPNGYTATFLTDERVADQGQGPVDVLGDIVAVLDSNFQAVWQWDTFDHVNLKRKALLNDTCPGYRIGCPPLRNKNSSGQYYKIANDWIHANSVTLDPSDNNLVVSSRHQSWIWKIAYENGTGNGHIIWTLGMGGDFALPSGVGQEEWFSYQHNAQFQANGELVLFDNGNYRIAHHGGNSRGQAWRLNLSDKVATPVVSFDLGAFSLAVGYASELSNGNYDFAPGFLDNGTLSQTIEFTPGGNIAYKNQVDSFSYRSIRLPNFYTQR